LRGQDDKGGECEKGDLFHNKGFELGNGFKVRYRKTDFNGVA
jgi:hypothetical protein